MVAARERLTYATNERTRRRPPPFLRLAVVWFCAAMRELRRVRGRGSG